MKAVILGGTGLIGSKVVAELQQHGVEAVPASPNTGVDAVTGAGLAEALAGADVVVDVSNSPSFADADVLAFFTSSTANLLREEASAGVRSHVALSIVGAERVPGSGYLRAKVAQERLIRDSGRPYSIVRATQFFEFARGIADSATVGGEVHLPPILLQPMAADEVAAAVARAALAPSTNAMEEVGGPEPIPLPDFVGRALREAGDPRSVIADPAAQYFGAVPAERALVPAADATLGRIRFEDWLQRRTLQRSS
ncbi:SDR family oxidoreductase [Naasia aerilata]|uniref:LysR family transcriptional regulator n=1 Tax=Naasia aerilata TaxID=1162966 RepID=A0ABM8GDM6_9MICO|nr:SDR family oxidoreductase [Naasia aerilata]BDZ46392.1 LysR family transcriptional regulator [Naasia aerilata]